MTEATVSHSRGLRIRLQVVGPLKSTEELPCDINTMPYYLAVSTQPRYLVVSTQPRYLAVSTQTREPRKFAINPLAPIIAKNWQGFILKR
jgi:hypothetical protein